MTEASGDEYRFSLLDPESYTGDPPFFVFYRRTDDGPDVPLFMKGPEEGLLWSGESDYGTDHSEVMEDCEPSYLFEKVVSAMMDDPAWRTCIDSDEPIGGLNPEIEADEDILSQLGLHERYLLRLIETMVDENYPFPPELKEYLFSVVR